MGQRFAFEHAAVEQQSRGVDEGGIGWRVETGQFLGGVDLPGEECGQMAGDAGIFGIGQAQRG